MRKTTGKSKSASEGGAAHGGPATLVLGIEGGGTRTSACWMDAAGRVLAEGAFGPGNVRLLSDAELVRLFEAIRAQGVPAMPAALGIGLAGARAEADRARIRKAAAAVWPGVPCHATNDLETALMAAPAVAGTKARVLVLSGTGSCCFGRAADGATAKLGGWGHILGDKGSGFEIGLRALKAVVYYYDRDGEWSLLGRELLRVLSLNVPDDLIGWVQSAEKSAIAALAVEVFRTAKRDAIARDILEGAAHSLASDAIACAKRLGARSHVQYVFAGSVLVKQPAFARKIANLIRKQSRAATFTVLKESGVRGAVALARLNAECRMQNAERGAGKRNAQRIMRKEEGKGGKAEGRLESSNSSFSILHSAFTGKLPWDPAQLTASPTEQRNPLTTHLDRMPVAKAVRLMLREDAKLPAAILREEAKIAWAVQQIAKSLKAGGRLFYAGAGTSGRLGVLDASECPPTFRTPPELVQGIMAGGQRAITQAVEGAEDDADAGAASVKFRGVTRRDVVVGIAASGRTPFVWGALWEAKRRGATTILLCFNPFVKYTRAQKPDCVIAPNLGPELLTGSTRLKSGTATKLILNIFTTLAMVQLGKVVGNLMVDLNPSNVKLRDRAIRIVRALTGADADTARAALERSGWVIVKALKRLPRNR